MQTYLGAVIVVTALAGETGNAIAQEVIRAPGGSIRTPLVCEIPRRGLSMTDVRQRPGDHDTVEAGNDASDLVVVTFNKRIHRGGLTLDGLKNR